MSRDLSIFVYGIVMGVLLRAFIIFLIRFRKVGWKDFLTFFAPILLGGLAAALMVLMPIDKPMWSQVMMMMGVVPIVEYNLRGRSTATASLSNDSG